ncbi:hypothetical protein I317_02137 [Kwoniella heveanensis CBS 569]|uniref:Peroxin-11C n=1 Tax=Kwoniella heveanensis BCC8398 TaxID=1296120 RepID=A0A1B9GKL6_9TREE|nr:hypothetical protein I316_06727 [Kwoniella heveanensis BCC8398]OCF44029.1 hypothetical protein I317_02137 [Kwoniella heveanensis CBS 569]
MSEPTTTSKEAPKPASAPSSRSPPSLSTRSRVLLARLTKLTSTLPGLDASLMLFQYSSPLVIALLLRLATLKSRYNLLRGKRGVVAGAGAGAGIKGGFGLVQLAEGWGTAALSVSEARVIMRAFGLLPILQWLLAIHPSPLKSLRSFLLSAVTSPSAFLNHPSEKTLPTLQILSLLAYYPLEHITWLSRKGVVPLSVQRTGLAELWSVRFWALYVLLEIFKLRGTYLSLLSRTKALKQSKPAVSIKEAEGYELPPSSSSPGQNQDQEKNALGSSGSTGAGSTSADAVAVRETLKKDWEAWKTAVTINSGYAPLTLHWSTIGGLWTNPLITGTFGSLAAFGSLTNAWRATAP